MGRRFRLYTMMYWIYTRLSVYILSFDGLKSPLLKKCFSDLNLYEAIEPPGLVVQIKLKV